MMKHDEIAAVIIAHGQGKRLETKKSSGAFGLWDGSLDLLVKEIAAGFEFRQAREPRLRPWKPEEVPVGAIINRRGFKPRMLIVGCNNYEVGVPILNSTNETIAFAELLKGYDYTTDGGKTWKPCGVEDAQ